MKETEKAWLAAAIDGEGWMGLYTRNRKWPLVEMGITNTNKDFLQYAVNIAGGKIRSAKINPELGGKKPVFRMSFKGHAHIHSVLKEIIPYLIIKKDKAKNIINFIEGRKWGAQNKELHRIITTNSWKVPEIRNRRINGMRHNLTSCTICGDKYYSKGYCQRHYNQIWRKLKCVTS